MPSPSEVADALDQLSVDIATAGGVQEVRDGSKSQRHYSLSEIESLRKAAEARAAATGGGNFMPGDPGLAGY